MHLVAQLPATDNLQDVANVIAGMGWQDVEIAVDHVFARNSMGVRLVADLEGVLAVHTDPDIIHDWGPLIPIPDVALGYLPS
jgi:hypothetical protein